VLGIEFIRFDMSEYQEKHSVSRLIGAPPGYVGYDRGGLLTDAVNKTPHAVLLLDEVEKAHPDVFSVLLQVMDHGTLTDNNGRPSDFRHTILIMTSNVGAQEMQRTRLGFGNTDVATGEEDKAYKNLFSPEFRNRLDARVHFKPLAPEVMERIVEKFVGELTTQLTERKVRIELTPAARAYLADEGYDSKMGARPLARVLDQQIKRKLSDAILFGDLQEGGRAIVHYLDGEITFELKPDEPEPKRLEGKPEPKLLADRASSGGDAASTREDDDEPEIEAEPAEE
jgi:ATP-dependent Clp protease ATP-binding subunit ClpA